MDNKLLDDDFILLARLTADISHDDLTELEKQVYDVLFKKGLVKLDDDAIVRYIGPNRP